ncbi:hypothetical protein LMG28688_01587 [Paraburkholderia caffeinitolerans]|uniref:Uncharacterized protein n=1 Tax=Paraburkholderia caffeinitolerans TaxID=1723730 RepID=A0A6J5FMT1_9BURK|nr:hypothetical protein [Paraburkholderia caffeinitolerans]CAB3783140.1 hypothetical protein LMG28688_01587 [Paraburkholderia caffeinitolerans]
MDLDNLIAQMGETLAAPITAQRMAFVVLVNALHAKGLIDRSDIAGQLEATARAMPPEVISPESISKHLYAIAEAIRTSTTQVERNSIQ